jgi:hypothetical protein
MLLKTAMMAFTWVFNLLRAEADDGPLPLAYMVRVTMSGETATRPLPITWKVLMEHWLPWAAARMRREARRRGRNLSVINDIINISKFSAN